MRVFRHILFPVLLLFAVPTGAQPVYSPNLFKQLDHVLSMKDTYDDYFDNRVNQVHLLYNEQIHVGQESVGLQYERNKILFDIFKSNSLDSALFYLNSNRELARRYNEQDKIIETDLWLSYMYAKSGFYHDATSMMESYTPNVIPDFLTDDYYFIVYTVTGELAHYSAEPAGLTPIRLKYRKRLLEDLPKDSYEWNNLMREQSIGHKDKEAARKYALNMLSQTTPGTNQHAQASYFISETYPHGSLDQMQWLIKSAISDLMSSTKDYVSLNEISKLLFEAGDIDRAFRYSADYCLPDAMYYNGRLRPLQLSQFFPKIQYEFQKKSEHQKRIRTHYMIALIVMLIALCVLTTVIFIRQRILIHVRNLLQESQIEIEKKNNHLIYANDSLQKANNELKELNVKIVESDKVKEEYISLFLSILSENISTTRQYSNHVLKCIRHGRTKDLEREINELPPIEEDINKFYKMFDQTFINMYPDFIDKFNELLQDGQELHPKQGEILCPEQRIFALIKLGITDSSKIAALLHYSTNTIYNYKAKVKNRARNDRNNFEHAVCEISC